MPYPEQKTSQRINCGAGKQARARSDALEKSPENGIAFEAYKPNQTHAGPVVSPSTIRTLTVGPGIPPSHVLETSTRGLYHRSGIAPCPEGCYSIRKIIPAKNRLSNHCSGQLSRPGWYSMPFRCNRPGKRLHTAVRRSDLRIRHRWRRQ